MTAKLHFVIVTFAERHMHATQNTKFASQGYFAQLNAEKKNNFLSLEMHAVIAV